MRRSWDVADRREVCPACGRRVARAAAREYDKHGDRWDRDEKAFEYLCRPCHDALCHQDRGDLEALLGDLEAGEVSNQQFLRRYRRAVEERASRPGERGDPGPDDTH